MTVCRRSLDVRNTGATASDEVVQIYGSALNPA